MGHSNMGPIVKDFEYCTRNLGYEVGSVYDRESF